MALLAVFDLKIVQFPKEKLQLQVFYPKNRTKSGERSAALRLIQSVEQCFLTSPPLKHRLITDKLMRDHRSVDDRSRSVEDRSPPMNPQKSPKTPQ